MNRISGLGPRISFGLRLSVFGFLPLSLLLTTAPTLPAVSPDALFRDGANAYRAGVQYWSSRGIAVRTVGRGAAP